MTMGPMNTPFNVGLGLKPVHFAEALAASADGLWYEVHPENYAIDGGPRLSLIEAFAARHRLSLHGVGLSLASDAAPDPAHLRRIRSLVERLDPWLVSEHLAWNTWRGIHLPDLLPFPRTTAALARIADNIARVQDALGRLIAIENPSHYGPLDGHRWNEVDFLVELCHRSGCRLLIDVANVHVGAHNLGVAPAPWLDAIPAELVAEIHVAGPSPDPVLGQALLIDSHDAPIPDPVWRLLSRLVARIGARPVLIERDGRIPPFAEMLRERDLAVSVLGGTLRPESTSSQLQAA
jgi:uncharacterized protein (UPF0276 family)